MTSLVFPGGVAPGFNPSHIAATGARFSGIASGANFYDLKTGKRAAIGNAPTFVQNNIIGPATKYATGADDSIFSGMPAASFTTYTAATILTFDTVSAGTQSIFSTSNSTSAGVSLRLQVNVSNKFTFVANGSGSIGPAGSIVAIANTPYFFVGSMQWATTLSGYVLVLNLSTGQVQTFSASGVVSTTPSADNGTCEIGNRAGITVSLASIAAAMYSTNYLPIQSAALWADDPWAFWYPDVNAF